MPRIYTSANDPVDYCIDCFPISHARAFLRHGYDGDGPDGRGNCFGYDAEHPPYDGEDYRCHNCGRLLRGLDDDPRVVP